MLMKRERKHRINQVQTSLFFDPAKKIARGAFAVSRAVRVKICKMSVHLFIQYNLGFLHVDKLSFFVILCLCISHRAAVQLCSCPLIISSMCM